MNVHVHVHVHVHVAHKCGSEAKGWRRGGPVRRLAVPCARGDGARPWLCVQACEEADAALRKRLGRRLRKLDREMDDGFQEALARLQAVCTELEGARRPIDWDG